MVKSLFAAGAFVALNVMGGDALVAKTHMTEERSLFKMWMLDHGRTYDTPADEDLRFRIFLDNHNAINKHNADPTQTFTKGHNQFSDLTPDEWQSQVLGFVVPANHTSHATAVFRRTGHAPATRDWRDHDHVTLVKNQGQCGSCWAFSTTGAVESAALIKHNASAADPKYILSEQQLVDCSHANHGCNGGVMDLGFDYLKNYPQGDDTEESYPYTGHRSWFCKAAFHEPSGIRVTGHVDVEKGDEDALMEAVGSEGPCSIAIEADQKSFQFYSGGVLTQGCGKKLDHGVLLIGYDEDAWIVKNSWGPKWGRDGYIYIQRGKDLCGVADMASFPLVA